MPTLMAMGSRASADRARAGYHRRWMTSPMDRLDAVRRRPGMFFGDVGAGDGALNLVLEVLGNALDLYLGGRCSSIELTLDGDGSFTVTDDGPGLTRDGQGSVPALAELFTRWSDRPTVDDHRPHVHLGLTGVGLPAVCALAEELQVISVHRGVEVCATFAAGRLIGAVEQRASDGASGTTIRVRPDRSVVTGRIPRVALTARLEELAHLCAGLRIGWRCAPDDGAGVGLVGLVRQVDGVMVVAHHRGRFGTADRPIDVEVALGWRAGPAAPVIHAFVNTHRSRDLASQHVRGLFDGVRAARKLGRVDATRGLVAAVSVVLADVIFGNPSHDRLDSRPARPAVAAATRRALAAAPGCVPPAR